MEPNTRLLARVFALLLAFQTSQSVPLQWQPIEGNHCSSRCSSDSQFIRFSEGKTYFYRIRTSTQLDGATGDDSLPLVVEGEVLVSARSACDLALQMQRIQIQGISDQTIAQQMARQLEATPLFFGYSDGEVTDVCHAPEDAQWALNVKRAVASALQMRATSLSAKTSVQESDLLGECLTEYQPMSARFGKHLIKKTKNLRNCNGQQWHSAVFPRAFQSVVSSVPIQSGIQECEQQLESDLIVGATCRETTSLLNSQPIRSELNLRFESQSNGNQISFARIQMKRNVLKMSSDSDHQMADEDLPKTLRQMCQHLDSSAEPKKALEDFQTLVQIINKSSKTSIEKTWNSMEENAICGEKKAKDLFLDACAMSGSSGAMKVLKNWFSKNNKNKKNEILFQSLAFNQNPKSEGIEELIEVLENKNAGNHVLLGISGFIHNAKHVDNNQEREHVLRASDRAIEALLRRLATSSEETEKIILIKALENIGIESNSKARQELASIASQSQSPDGVRVSALKALSERMTENERNIIQKVLENEKNSNEVRIQSYKAIVMSGGKAEDFQRIREVVKRDSNQDLIQFIRSHIKNLKETSDPHKRQIAKEVTSQQWAEPKSQWAGLSNNFEGSFMIDALGLGAVVEADVIHEKKSLAPNHVNLNFSLPLFGREISLFELEFRQKGFEEVLQKKIQQIKNARHLQDMTRVLYSLDTWQQEARAHNAYLEISAKIDGKYVFVYNSKQNSNSNSNHVIEALFASQESAFGVQPINTRLELPSTNGWPVVAHLNATMVTLMKSQISNNKASVTPSFAFKAEFGLELRAHSQKKAVGVAFTVQSQPEWESRHEINEKQMNLKVIVGKEKISLFKVSAEVKGNQNGSRRTGSQYRKCSESTRKPFGMVLCFEKREKEFEIYFEKTDKSLQSFEIQVSRDSNHIRMSFNSPNSQIDRHLESEVIIESNEEVKSLRMSVRSPWCRYAVNGQMKNDQKEQSIQLSVSSDGKTQLNIDLGLEQQSRGQKREFRPRVRLQVGEGQKEQINLQGTVGISKGRKNQLQINLEGNQKQFLKGSFVREGERKSSDIRVSSDLSLQLFNGIEMRLNALLDKGIKHVTSDLQLEYRMRSNAKKESLKTSLKVQNLTQSSLKKMSAFAELTSTQFPQFNTHVAYNLLSKPEEHVENELTIQWNQRLSEKVHVLQLTKVIEGHSVENTLQLEISPLRVNYELRANGVKNGNQVSAEVSGKDRTGEKKNDFRAQMQYKHVSQSPLHLTLSANLKSERNQFEYSDELREQSKNEFKGETRMNWRINSNEKKSAKLDYDYKIKSNDNQLHHEMALQVDSPFTQQPIRHQALLRMSRDVTHVKSNLRLNDQDYALESLLANQGQSKVEWAGLGYQVRAHAHPYQLPQLAEVEIVTPSVEHKTNIEVIPRKVWNLKTNTKRNGNNVFALDSEISSLKPSKVVFSSKHFDGRLDSDFSSDRKSTQLQVKHVTDDWSHSSSLNSNPFVIQSKTISNGRPLLTIDSGINPKKTFLSVEYPPKQSSVSAEYNPRKSAKVEIACGQKFKHVSQWNHNGNDEHVFDSTQTDFRSGLPLYSVKMNSSPKSSKFDSEFGQNYGIEGEWNESSGSFGTGSAYLAAKAKNQRFETKSKLNFNHNNKKYDFSSKTSKNGQNFAEIESQINGNADQESNFRLSLPQHATRASIYATPSKETKISIQTNPNSNHVTSLQWNPNLNLDSKTTFDNKVFALVARNHLKSSFASLKTPQYDISGHVEADHVTPSAKWTFSGPEVSHVTEVSANRNRKSIRVESKANRKSGDNIYSIDGVYNHNNPSDASTVQMKIFNHKMNAKLQPFAQKRVLNIQSEHPFYNHVTDLEVEPNNYVSLRSRTLDRTGSNLAKIDSYLDRKSKSHVTYVSPALDCNLEVEPQSASALFEVNTNQWKHKSSVEKSSLGLKLDSKTKRFNNNYLDLNSLLSANSDSHLNLNSRDYESRVNVSPAQRSAHISIKAPSFEHNSQINAKNEILINSQTKYQNNPYNVNFNSNQDFSYDSNDLSAGGQWSANHVTMDYKSKLPKGRHLLAAIRVNPEDKKGFHADFAWDQQQDQRVTIDWSSRETSGQSWSEKKIIHSLSASYSGNEINLLSEMSKNNVILGPNELSIKYVPKYNKERDEMSLNIKHVIHPKDREMACELSYSEGKKEKIFTSLKTQLNNNSFVASLTSRAPNNPQLEGKIEVNARADQWKTRSAQLFAEVKAIRATKQLSYSLDLKRNSNSISGEVRIETPSSGEKKIQMKGNLENNELEVSLTGSEGKKAEMKARIENNSNSKRISLDLKSNIENIPSIALNGDYIPETEVSFRADVDGQRKAEMSVIRTGSLETGSQITVRFESPFYPKFDSKTSFKRTLNEINFESEAKVDSREVFAAKVSAKRQSSVWSGQLVISRNGAEVVTSALDSTFGPNSMSYVLNAKSRDFSPIKVSFSAQKQNKEHKVVINACANNGNTCLDISAALKKNEKVFISVSKLGTNVELKASLNEELDSTSGQSLLGLSSGRTQWKRRSGLSLAVNGHKMGFELTSGSRDNNREKTCLKFIFRIKKK